MKYLLYNPLSGSGKSKEDAETYSLTLKSTFEIMDITKISSYREFFEKLDEKDEIYIFGGDGTLNRFVNDTDGIDFNNKVYYYPSGVGNDFSLDVGKKDVTMPFQINKYIKKLPIVIVNGKKYKFINGVGFGIDGYCCEVGDKMKAEGKLPNYTRIAIKGLLKEFTPRNATVTVDGRKLSFKNVWIAPTMYGSHYGGGMIPTPNQKRDSKRASLMIFYGAGKLKTLMIFSSIFKGKHIKHKKNVEIICGKEINVRFDNPTPLQIDGETVLNVLEYSVKL